MTHPPRHRPLPGLRRGWLVAGAVMALLVSAEATRATEARGGRVGWARLATPQTQWGRHGNQDPRLASFIAEQTSLNLDPVWRSVAPDNLENLCVYPYIFVKDIVRLANSTHLQNLAEYLRRGGFFCIDPCVNGYSPAQKADLIRQNEALFLRLLPGCTVGELPDDHEIYRCYFPVGVDDLYTPDMISRGAIKPARIGMHGVFLEGRMIALISITGLECGWPETPQRAPGCMRMITNTYIYAMTR